MKGQINIIGDIGDFMSGEPHTSLIDVIAQVKQQPEATSFDVIINSVGGYVEEGFDIYYYLKSLGVPVTTIGQNVVASIATVIFMAGSTRRIEPDTAFMIHLPMGTVRGTADEILAYSQSVKKIEERVLDFYTQEYGLSVEAIKPLLRNETWLSEKNLAELGITNEIVIGVAARAEIQTDKTKNKSKMKTNEKSILQKVMNIIKNEGVDVDGKVVAKTLFDANQKEVVFADVAEDEAVKVGDTAMHDDKPAEGAILLADGRTFNFEGGKLMTIVEKVEEEDAPSEEMKALTLENEKLKKSVTDMTAKFEAEKAKNEKNQKVIDAIAKLESDMADDEKRKKEKDVDTTSRFQKAIAK